jgi:tetratricopeptide (TPR) repeat protein
MRVVCAVLLLWAANSRADENDAHAIYHEGEVAYQLGRFAEAAAKFERAYELSQRASILFDVAQSYRLWWSESHELAHLRKAVSVYRAFLRTGEGEWERRTAEKLLGELSPQLERAEHPPPHEEAPAPAPAPTNALVAAPAPPPSRVHRWRWPLGFGVAALVVAATGTGLIGAVAADYPDLQRQWNAMPTSDLQSRAHRLEAMADTSYAMFAVAGALAIVDIALIVRAARR